MRAEKNRIAPLAGVLVFIWPDNLLQEMFTKSSETAETETCPPSSLDCDYASVRFLLATQWLLLLLLLLPTNKGIHPLSTANSAQCWCVHVFMNQKRCSKSNYLPCTAHNRAPIGIESRETRGVNFSAKKVLNCLLFPSLYSAHPRFVCWTIDWLIFACWSNQVWVCVCVRLLNNKTKNVFFFFSGCYLKSP